MTRKWFNGSDVPAMEGPLKLWLLRQAVGPAMDASMQVRAHDAPASVVAGSVLISMQPHRKALLQSALPHNRKGWTLPCCMQALEKPRIRLTAKLEETVRTLEGEGPRYLPLPSAQSCDLLLFLARELLSHAFLPSVCNASSCAASLYTTAMRHPLCRQDFFLGRPGSHSDCDDAFRFSLDGLEEALERYQGDGYDSVEDEEDSEEEGEGREDEEEVETLLSQGKMYVVEAILGLEDTRNKQKRKRLGSRRYYVKWLDYPLSESSWQSVQDVKTAPEAVLEYWMGKGFTKVPKKLVPPISRYVD